MTFRKANRARKMIGVLVLAKFKLLEDEKFLRAACSRSGYPDVVEVKFAEPYHRPHLLRPIESLPFHSVVYTGLPSQKPAVRLYSLPPSAPRDFHLGDLEFPSRIAGSILIVGLHEAILSRLHWTETLARFKIDISFEEAMRKGEIMWIREHQLPFVVAAVGSTLPAMSLDELRSLFALEPEVPIISCPSPFRREDVKRVLLALVQQIDS